MFRGEESEDDLADHQLHQPCILQRFTSETRTSVKSARYTAKARSWPLAFCAGCLFICHAPRAAGLKVTVSSTRSEDARCAILLGEQRDDEEAEVVQCPLGHPGVWV